MEPRISIITLGVTDLKRSIAFYKDGLGLPLKQEMDNIAFFKLEGIELALYPRADLAEDATVSIDGSGFPAFTLAHNLRSKEEVDALLKVAEAAGAVIVKPARKVFWGGYSGYFTDPDGFYWEVAYNPYFEFD